MATEESTKSPTAIGRLYFVSLIARRALSLRPYLGKRSLNKTKMHLHNDGGVVDEVDPIQNDERIVIDEVKDLLSADAE